MCVSAYYSKGGIRTRESRQGKERRDPKMQGRVPDVITDITVLSPPNTPVAAAEIVGTRPVKKLIEPEGSSFRKPSCRWESHPGWP